MVTDTVNDDEAKKAILLLSGGLDSATTGALAKAQGYSIHALSFRYGQRHHQELGCAQQVAQHLGVTEHRIIDIDLAAFGGSALTSDMAVPKHRSEDEISHGIPITYVPARNTIFLSFALAYAEVIGAYDIFIGVNAVDYSGYPDCRPEFIESFERMANLATACATEGKGRLTLHTPLIDLTKAEIIEEGMKAGVDYGITQSCYDPDARGYACGHCDACVLRLRGFAQAGYVDSALYQET